MKNQSNITPSNPRSERTSIHRLKTIFLILQLTFVAAIFILWFSSESLRTSKNILILFLCCFPANFISGIIPYDPAIIFFGKYYSPFHVTLVGVFSTLFVEGINYFVLKYISNAKFLIKIRHNSLINRFIHLFHKAPFIALFIAGFLPIPFYPFRLLVVLAGYPLMKFLLTIFISRIPRMYLLALFGRSINIPDYIIVLFFIAIIIITYVSMLVNSIKNRDKT